MPLVRVVPGGKSLGVGGWEPLPGQKEAQACIFCEDVVRCCVSAAESSLLLLRLMNAFYLTPVLVATLGLACLRAAPLPESQKIDELLAQDWTKNGLKPQAPASEEVLVRRLYLDIVGRIPTVAESRAFLESRDPEKRLKLIDTLLASDGYTSHMFNYWADILRLTDNVKGRLTAEAYEEWLKKQLKANTPYDQLVHSLLTTDGAVWDEGSIGFWLRDENKLDHLAYTTQVFLGTSIVCAQCHNHPFDKWTQMDYYHMAAFTYGMDTKSYGLDVLKQQKAGKLYDKKALAAMSAADRAAAVKEMRAARKDRDNGSSSAASREEMQQVKNAMQDVMKPLRYTQAQWNDNRLPNLPADYKYPDGKPGQRIEPKTMFGHEAVPQPGQTRLQAFADWMTSPQNPRFTTVIANRMWKKAFGLGLIEPVDEMTDSTVASNAPLMDYLTQLMVEKKYSLKSFLRVLYNTDAYQRAAATQEVAPGEVYHFTGPLLRRMSAEQIWDSLVTLVHGNVDGAIEEDNTRLHQYLDDLAFFLNTVKARGVEGLVTVAKSTMEKRADNQKKLEEMRASLESAKAKEGSDPEAAKELVREANKLRRQTSNDILVALLGEERADELREGYRPGKEEQGKVKKLSQELRPQVGKKELASMTKEQKKQFLESYRESFATLKYLGTRASEQPSPARPGTFLRTFGQSDRELISNASDEASVPQALTLLNGPLSDSLSAPSSQLAQQLAEAPSAQEKIALLYQALLSRRPTAQEASVLAQVVAERGDKAVQDVTHALLSGSQFLFVQ